MEEVALQEEAQVGDGKLTIEEEVNAWLIDQGREPLTPLEELSLIEEIHLVKAEQSVRAKRDFLCEAQGEGEINCSKTECKAHIITQKFRAIRAVKKNLLYICKKHEKYFNEKGLTVWFTFVKAKYPERYEFVKGEYEYILREYEEFLKV